MAGFYQPAPIAAHTYEDIDTRDTKLFEFLNKPDMNCPLIIFGAENMCAKIEKNLPGRRVFDVVDKQTMDDVQMRSSKMKDEIILLYDGHVIGVDIRTEVPLRVVIVCKTTLPTQTNFKQMAGRAFRSKYFPKCHVFTTTGVDTEDQVCMKI